MVYELHLQTDLCPPVDGVVRGGTPQCGFVLKKKDTKTELVYLLQCIYLFILVIYFVCRNFEQSL